MSSEEFGTVGEVDLPSTERHCLLGESNRTLFSLGKTYQGSTPMAKLLDPGHVPDGPLLFAYRNYLRFFGIPNSSLGGF